MTQRDRKTQTKVRQNPTHPNPPLNAHAQWSFSSDENGFFKTGMGRKLLDRDLPEFINQLTRLNDNLERLIDLRDGAPSENPPSEVPNKRVWIGAFNGEVLFVSAALDDAKARKAAFDATGYTCTLSGPFEVQKP